MKRLLILGALALGCDNPALLANIDTYMNEMPENQYSAPIETCCTGFNFEAFGVEP